MVKNLPTIQETWVWFLGLEDPLKKRMATHSSILARGQKSLVSCSPWDHKESDMTEWLTKDSLEVYRVRSGRVQNVGTSVPMELECAITGFTHQSGSFFYPILGIFVETSSFRWDQLLSPFRAPLPSLEDEGWCSKFQASNHSLVGDQPPSRSAPRVPTSLEQKTQPSPRKFQGIYELCVRDQDQRLNVRTQDSPSTTAPSLVPDKKQLKVSSIVVLGESCVLTFNLWSWSLTQSS